ncbi:hypothetical protein [Aeromonas simiae]|uniref:hypothetical protein n=1 Tax=Aeromonas simiae TaxID=218936 RepID=UPI00266CA7A2|nr:hypothetical protein [Aeromonas simiae]MDO2950292.1 hypothetical protein [Aeromonas simiae]MDO2953959.1 hypothetical protein [Aeromonas simiae]MDO2957715.1 hypothetical protein [Aeromonas simiae]
MVKRNLVIKVAILSLLFSPVVLYINTFGGELSQDHSRWSEFGSVIGGIYAPILGFITLVVLTCQLSLQNKMNDQYYLQQLREDIEFYASQLSNILDESLVGNVTLRAVLHEKFMFCSHENLCSMDMKNIAIDIHKVMPQALDIWAAIYPVLIGLSAIDDSLFKMTLASSKQKLVALLSFEICVALDNLHFCRVDGKNGFTYVFNQKLQ